MPIAAFPVTAAFSPEQRVVAKLQEGIFLRARHQIDVATAATVATAGAAPRNKPFPPKRDAAAPAAPRLDRDLRFVDEHGETRLARRKAHRQKT